MFSRRLLAATFGAAILAVSATATMHALSISERTTYLTFSRSVALPGVELAAGTYIFELVMPESNSNIVRVLSKDRRRVYLTAITGLVQRPHNLKDMVTFGEAPRGMAPPIKAWFPPETSTGRLFLYR
jgi:hypothetical protein